MKKVLQLFVIIWCVAIITAFILNAGCGSVFGIGDSIYQHIMEGKGCGPTASGCEGDKLLLCNADHMWELNTDCTDFETPRNCCTINTKPGCYRTPECGATQ